MDNVTIAVLDRGVIPGKYRLPIDSIYINIAQRRSAISKIVWLHLPYIYKILSFFFLSYVYKIITIKDFLKEATGFSGL